MEYRAGNTIINTDRKTNETDYRFLQAMTHFIEGVMCIGESRKTHSAIHPIIKKFAEDIAKD